MDLLIFAVITAAALAIVKYTRSTQRVSASRVTVLEDITEPLNLPVLADPICRKFGLTYDAEKGAVLRIGTISNKGINRIVDYSRRDVVYDENADSRDIDCDNREVRVYYQHCRQLIAYNRPLDQGTCPARLCFVAVCTELHFLVASNSSDRCLLIYSSLIEQGRLFSPTCATCIKMLRETPKKIAEIFEKHMPLPNLRGIEVHVIYEPTEASDLLHRQFIKLYKYLVEKHGGTFRAQADNTYIF